MELSLKGKNALVTGGARGIGRAIVDALARSGANVAFTYRSSTEEAETLRLQVEALGVSALALQSDAGDFGAAEETVQTVIETWGTLDVLVNNAGITRDGLLLRTREDDWDAVIATNLNGFSKSLAKELGSRGITVNVIAPGYVDTDMTRSMPDAAKEAMLADVPLGRAATPEDIAASVVFLASSAADYVTGHVLHVDGGLAT
jgi:3-oxoacyl-[acyl-carrier protein] reductase